MVEWSGGVLQLQTHWGFLLCQSISCFTVGLSRVEVPAGRRFVEVELVALGRVARRLMGWIAQTWRSEKKPDVKGMGDGRYRAEHNLGVPHSRLANWGRDRQMAPF